MKRYDKLIRDNVPDVLDQLGIKYTCRILTDDWEIAKYLAKKLVEEAKEVVDSLYGENRDTVDELNDVALVLEELQNIFFSEIGFDEALDRAIQKDIDKGRFDKRILLESVDDGE